MSLDEIKRYSFPEQTYESWKQKAEESLKGRKLDTISKTTYENIQLKPLYTKEDRAGKEMSQFPGGGDYRRGSKALGYIEAGWKIAQRIDTTEPEAFKARLTSSLQKGQNAIAFTPNLSIVKELSKLVENEYDSVPFSVNAEEFQAEIINILSGLPHAKQISGYIGKDPISLFAKNGKQSGDMNEVYQRFYENVSKAAKEIPHVKTILIDSTVYHNGGANAVQELAISLAAAVHHIEQLKNKGMTVEEIVPKMVFHFSIGSQFFVEVAKLRAARVLWSRMTKAYQLPEELQGKMEISADTSWFTKTVYDPYVNLLRAGNEAFAAVLGGVQYLHVSPFNEPEGKDTDFSDRIARNTQLLLNHEARLGTVIDPAGGSWYIESLTDELVDKAWALFLEIDEKGGIVEVLQNNWLQEQIKEVKSKRQEDIFTRKATIVGTNQYANLQDEPLQVHGDISRSIDSSAIQQERLSEPYEQLRFMAEKLSPLVGLICLGKLKSHKARADFIDGFLAPGGIAAERSEEIESASQALNFINRKKRDFYVVCGSDAEYEKSGLDTIQAIKKEFPAIKLYVAGLPPEGEQAAWRENGVVDFITMKSNCYAALRTFLKEIEVEKVHE